MMEEVVKWYRGFAIEQAEVEQGKLKSIKSEGSKIIVELSNVDHLKEEDKQELAIAIMNADDDGNHPLTINKKVYIVQGDNLKIRH